MNGKFFTHLFKQLFVWCLTLLYFFASGIKVNFIWTKFWCNWLQFIYDAFRFFWFTSWYITLINFRDHGNIIVVVHDLNILSYTFPSCSHSHDLIKLLMRHRFTLENWRSQSRWWQWRTIYYIKRKSLSSWISISVHN